MNTDSQIYTFLAIDPEAFRIITGGIILGYQLKTGQNTDDNSTLKPYNLKYDKKVLLKQYEMLTTIKKFTPINPP